MARDDIREELEEIRAQLDALRNSRPAQVKEDVESVDATAQRAKGGDLAEPVDAATGDDGHDIAAQFQELVEVLDREIRETNPTTLLVVFALGVLVGRLLPR